jgi:S-adenosylmethionine synthetase
VPGVEEARVLLASRIGRPLDDPWIAACELAPATGVGLGDVAGPAREVFARELRGVPALVERLVRGELPVC